MNEDDVRIVVFAHDEYQAMFDMNLPLWEAHEAPIVVVCPEGHSVKTKHECMEYGAIGSDGPQMIERHLGVMLQLAWHHIESFYAFFETDAICITKDLPLKKALWGNTFKNIHSGYGHHQEDWVTWQYLNFPWIIDRASLARFVTKAEEYPDVIEGGYVDRWIAVIAQAAGIPMVRFSPRGFSRSKINLDDPIEFAELERVIREGGTMFHGVKTKAQQDSILALRKKYFP